MAPTEPSASTVTEALTIGMVPVTLPARLRTTNDAVLRVGSTVQVPGRIERRSDVDAMIWDSFQRPVMVWDSFQIPVAYSQCGERYSHDRGRTPIWQELIIFFKYDGSPATLSPWRHGGT